MSYKFLNTIIDDLFAFVIKMPLLHRLSGERWGDDAHGRDSGCSRKRPQGGASSSMRSVSLSIFVYISS